MSFVIASRDSQASDFCIAPQSYQKLRGREAFQSSSNIVKKERRSRSIILSHGASTLDCIWSIDCWSIFLSLLFSHDQVRALNWNHIKSFKHDRVKKAIFSHDMITPIFSQESHALSLSEPSNVSFICQLPLVAPIDSGTSTCQTMSREKVVTFGK